MEYKGKLYGKIGNKYFDTSHTTEDWDKLTSRVEELENQLKQGSKLPMHHVSGMFISVDYLMGIHPELNREEAESLKEYANSHTIRYKDCYGDGSIMYPRWKESNYR